MSAPAMKPLRLAEQHDDPAGFGPRSSVSAAASSSSTPADSTLVEVPGDVAGQPGDAVRIDLEFPAAARHGDQAAARRDSRMVKSQISGR